MRERETKIERERKVEDERKRLNAATTGGVEQFGTCFVVPPAIVVVARLLHITGQLLGH